LAIWINALLVACDELQWQAPLDDLKPDLCDVILADRNSPVQFASLIDDILAKASPNDNILAAQLNFLRNIQLLMWHFASFKRWVFQSESDTATRETRTLKSEIAEITIRCRKEIWTHQNFVEGVRREMGADSLGTAFISSGNGSIFDAMADALHMSAFDGLPYDNIGNGVSQLVSKQLADAYSMWAEDMGAMANIIIGSIPNYESLGANLLKAEKDHKEGYNMMLALLQNESYPALSAAVPKLQDMLLCAQSIHKDRLGYICSAVDFKKYANEMHRGRLCVTITYVMFNVLVELPKKAMTAKNLKDAVMKLRGSLIGKPSAPLSGLNTMGMRDRS
jgi:hypothetical protein